MPRITDWTGILKTRSGYLVRVQVRPLPQRAKRFPRGTALEAMQRWRDRTREALERAKPRSGTPGSVEADVAEYLARWGTGKHPQTVAQRRRHLELFAEIFRRRARVLLTTAEIEAQLQAWQRDGLPISDYARQRRGDPKPLTLETVKKIRQSIYQLYALLDRGAGLPNPVAAIPVGSAPEPDERGHAPADVAAVIRKLPAGSKTKARCAVMAYVGLRPDEVRHVQRRDFAPTARTLFVRSGKGSERVRVPLTRRGAAALRYFFHVGAEGSFTSAPLNRMLKIAAASAKLDPAGWDAYSLRHSFGAWHYAASRDIKATKQAMRHKSIRMTERYVRTSVAPMLAKSIEDLDAALRLERQARRRDQQRDQHGAPTRAKTRSFLLIASNPDRPRDRRETRANLRKIAKK